MWISRSEYEYLINENKKLRAKADTLDSILNYATQVRTGREPEVVIGDNFYLVSREAFDEFLSRVKAAEDSVYSITAERDWYKSAYTELKGRLDILNKLDYFN